MKYIVDRIEDNLVILEKYPTKEIIKIDKNILSNNIHEGSIIIYDGDKYYIDIDEELKKRKEILEKFMRLRNEEDE